MPPPVSWFLELSAPLTGSAVTTARLELLAPPVDVGLTTVSHPPPLLPPPFFPSCVWRAQCVVSLLVNVTSQSSAQAPPRTAPPMSSSRMENPARAAPPSVMEESVPT